MQTIHEILQKSSIFLQQKGIANSRRQAEEVIGDALNLERLQLYLQFERPLTEKELEKCREMIVRRSKGEPAQYLRGFIEFLDCRIHVTPDVLIPRQETEILADKIVKMLEREDLSQKKLWDVCCGSGCIGIALKRRFPQLSVTLSDVSEKALGIAKKNCLENGLEVEILQGDFLTPFNGRKTDYFVCNPPYVSEEEFMSLDREVKDFEPKLALVSGENGLEFYRKLSEELANFLRPCGKAWLEMGHTHGEQLKKLFSSPIWQKNEVWKDWSGKDRFFFLEIE